MVLTPLSCNRNAKPAPAEGFFKFIFFKGLAGEEMAAQGFRGEIYRLVGNYFREGRPRSGRIGGVRVIFPDRGLARRKA